MKKTIIFLILGIIIFGCNTTSLLPGVVRHLQSNGTEIIEVKSDEYGESLEEATSNAEKAAIKQLIFYGLAESPLSDPMTKEGIELLDKHEGYFNELLVNNGYRKFITCSNVLTSEKIHRTMYHNTVHCCVAYRNLRMDLEKNGVIKKLGF
jgi:hypothetical protein